MKYYGSRKSLIQNEIANKFGDPKYYDMGLIFEAIEENGGITQGGCGLALNTKGRELIKALCTR